MGFLPASRAVVLLGAGHAHVEVLRRFARTPLSGAMLTLLTDKTHTLYSGMLPGVVRGDYTASQARVDCGRLARAAGAHLVIGHADGLDLDARRILVAGQGAVAFNVLSIDVGAQSRMPGGDGIAVKPIGPFLARLDALMTSAGSVARVAVVGAGPAGAELALALAARWPDLHITLVASEAEILPHAPARARARIRAELARNGVTIVAGRPATGFNRPTLALRGGDTLAADAALWASGVTAPAFLARAGLACDAQGCVRTDAALRSVSHPEVFAAGDCAAMDAAPRPKAGVWAVRAGAPLAENLRRALDGRPPRSWRPQRTALVMLGLGHGRAVVWRGPLVLAGRLAWLWKDRIDRRWVARNP